MNFDHSMEDKNEQECVEGFIRSICGCKLGPQGSPCSSSLTKVSPLHWSQVPGALIPAFS